MMHSTNIRGTMRRMLPREVMRVIARLAQVARERRFRAYVVGGFVRDILLGVKNLDVDIVVEGDAIEFAAFASERLKTAMVKHKRFGTATLIARRPAKGRRFKIDIATARTESYRQPAALPSVEFSSIRGDLYRRDFTINAMAVSIDKRNFGELVDFFGGRRDLRRKRIRVLHDKSFIDDPTRIFRAVRFEQRYNFTIERRTVSLIKNAVKREMFEKVSGERLRKEIELLLKEKDPLKAIKRMRSLHELRFISAKIQFDAGSERICGNIRECRRRYQKYFLKKREIDLWLVFFLALLDRLSLRESLKVCRRFAMRRSDRLRIISCKKRERRVIGILTSARPVRPSRIYRALEPLSYEVILFLTAKSGSKRAGRRVADFLRKYNGTRLKINGADIKKLGVRPGPEFTRILRQTLYAKIDGTVRTKKDEFQFAEKAARSCLSP